jgi:diacylglycerol kinase (ATP)
MSEKRQHAAVVYHPLKTDVDALANAVERHESRCGFGPTLWYATRAHDSGQSAVERALEDEPAVVLASGGDGTIRTAAEVMRGRGVPLAIIPQGTGNLMARNIGEPLTNIDEQARAAFSGENFPIDLGVAEIIRENNTTQEHVFLVLAGMGLDARAIVATNPKLKKTFGWLAYVDAGLRTIFTERPLQLTYRADGGARRSLKVFTAMVGNCGLLPGGVLLIPDAKMDDGKLDVVALRPLRRLGPFSWLRIINKIGWENGVLRRSRTGRKIIDLVHDAKSVTYRQVKNIELFVDRPEPVQLDGDDFGKAVQVRTRVDPGALTLRVLPQWDARI